MNHVHVKNLRQTEKFAVNFAKTSTYQKSAIPYYQKLHNNHYSKKWKLAVYHLYIIVNDDLNL